MHLIKNCEHKYDAIREKTKVCKCPEFTSQLLIYLLCGRLAFKSRSSYLDCDPTGPLPTIHFSDGSVLGPLNLSIYYTLGQVELLN